MKHNDAASPSKTPPKKAKAPISQIQSPAIERNKAYKKRKLSEGHNSNVEDEARAPKRRSKTKVVIGDDEGSVSMTQKLSGPTEGKSKKTSKSVKDKPVVNGDLSDDGSDLSDVLSASPVQDTLGDSDLSEVLDEAPKPKRKKNSTDKKAKAEPRNIGKPNKSQNSDPQGEEIKSLQRWLAKCGIRKFWAKELKTYETPREKIKHLKGMLSDVGMTGRYSKEKAASIRETRELAADLEAVQEGAKLWGKDGDDHKAERRRPTRTTLTNIDFIEYDSED